MLENAKLYIIGGTAALIVSLIGVLALSRAHLQTEIARINGQYALCQSANADWMIKTRNANEALDHIRAEAQQRATEALKASAAAEKSAAAHKKLAAKIAQTTKQGDACLGAADLMRAYLRGRP